LKEAEIGLDLRRPASPMQTKVPQLGEFVTRDEDFDHGPEIDHQLRYDNGVKGIAFCPAGADKLEHVHAESDSGESRTHDAGGLGEIFPFHRVDAVFGGEACLMLSQTIVE
jgi:hypothetical protein